MTDPHILQAALLGQNHTRGLLHQGTIRGVTVSLSHLLRHTMCEENIRSVLKCGVMLSLEDGAAGTLGPGCHLCTIAQCTNCNALL